MSAFDLQPQQRCRGTFRYRKSSLLSRDPADIGLQMMMSPGSTHTQQREAAAAGCCVRDSTGRSGSWRLFLTRSLDRKLERKRVASQGLGFFSFFLFFPFSIKRIFHRIENPVRVTQGTFIFVGFFVFRNTIKSINMFEWPKSELFLHHDIESFLTKYYVN